MLLGPDGVLLDGLAPGLRDACGVVASLQLAVLVAGFAAVAFRATGVFCFVCVTHT